MQLVERYLQILRIIERENQTGIGVNELVKKPVVEINNASLIIYTI
jgi:hypothetical protein